jgi:hypothetical protein
MAFDVCLLFGKMGSTALAHIAKKAETMPFGAGVALLPQGGQMRGEFV